jgi:hypothetical protein
MQDGDGHMIRSVRRLALCLLALLVGLGGVTVGGEPASAAPPVPYDGLWWMARLAVVGDSITNTSSHVFKPAFRAEWWRDATFSFPGVRTETMRDQIRAMAADRPDAFVVQLGGLDTLDLISGARSWNFERAQIAGVITDLQAAGVPCIVWAGPNENFDGGAIDFWAERINDEIQAQLALRGMGSYADWSAVAAGHPEYFVADGAHLTPLGMQVYADLLATRLRDCARNPKGSFDGATPGVGVRVQGWAFDPDTAAPSNVHVYIDGAFRGQVTANSFRPDVAAAFPGVSSNHGFDATFVVGGGVHDVCVFALNVGPYGFTNPVLGCKRVVVDGSPIGFLDSAIGGAGSTRLRGWTIDSDVTWPIDVHVYVDGAIRTAATAGVNRPDLAAAFPPYGGAHGYDVTVSGLPPGSHEACAYGINNVFTPGGHRLLGCRIVNVG